VKLIEQELRELGFDKANAILERCYFVMIAHGVHPPDFQSTDADMWLRFSAAVVYRVMALECGVKYPSVYG